MKKSVLALATAAVLAAPLAVQADTILYGSARASIDYEDVESSYVRLPDGRLQRNLVGSSGWDVVNNSSRLGVLGSEDLGGGLSAVYQYEFGVDLTEGGNFESNRPKLVGLKGGFGTLTIGTQETPYYHVAGVVDVFNTDKALGTTAFLGGSFNGLSLNPANDRDLGGGALFRLENSLYYITPDFSGFTAEAMLVMNGSRNDSAGYSNGIDLWNIAAKYSNGPFFVGASYIKLEGENNVSIGNGFAVDLDLDQWNVGLGYSAGPFSVGFIYEQGSLNEFGLLGSARQNGQPLAKGDDARNWYLSGEYRFGNNTIRGAYGRLDTRLGGQQFDDTIDNYLVGYQYDFSKRTRLWVEYVGRSADTILFTDQSAISVGTRVDF